MAKYGASVPEHIVARLMGMPLRNLAHASSPMFLAVSPMLRDFVAISMKMSVIWMIGGLWSSYPLAKPSTFGFE